LQHGRAVGFVDAVRFLTELGRAFFYSGMDPDLAIEKRISGDPAVPHFWGYIQALIFADPNCLPQLIGPVGESAAEQTKIFLEFWFRYDVCLSVYRNSVRERFEQVRDLYASNFELAFPFSTPHFLYLYDLIRSNGATARAAGFFSANAALERLREMYGKRWFANSHFSQRMRDYWWSGFSLTLDQILNDWGIPV